MYLRMYLCKKCNKKFIIPLDLVVNPKYWYASVFKDCIASIMDIEYRLLRKTAEELRIFLGRSLSHETRNGCSTQALFDLAPAGE